MLCRGITDTEYLYALQRRIETSTSLGAASLSRRDREVVVTLAISFAKNWSRAPWKSQLAVLFIYILQYILNIFQMFSEIFLKPCRKVYRGRFRTYNNNLSISFLKGGKEADTLLSQQCFRNILKCF